MISLKHFCALGVTAFLAVAPGCTQKADPASSRRVVLKVNSCEMTAAVFSEALALRLRSYSALTARDSAVIAQAKNGIVQDFIVQVVTQDWAKKNSVFVRKEALDQEIARVRSSYPDDVSFRRALAEEGLVYQRRSITDRCFPQPTVWVDRVEFSALERLVLAEVTKSAAAIPPADVKKYYEDHRDQFKTPAQVRLRQIVLETEIAAERARKEIQSGKSMATLAKEFSISPDGRDGGDLGWIEKGTAEVFDAAFNLGVGARSQVTKSPFGFHILEVLGKRPAKTLSLEEARPKITKILEQRDQNMRYREWLESQIVAARVFKDDAFITALQVTTRSP